MTILLPSEQDALNPGLVEKLPVEYYGTPTPLMQLASISIPEPRSIMIKPFDPTTLKVIEKVDPGLRTGTESKQ